MKSIFLDKTREPSTEDLQRELAGTFALWLELAEYVVANSPKARGSWHYSGEKFGWSYRISDNKRTLLYLLPRKAFFKAALVFGQKAAAEVLEARISGQIKNELNAAKAYAEGRGIRIPVTDASQLDDIRTLIAIKLAH